MGDSIFDSERAGIIRVRLAHPNVSAYKLAKAIRNGDHKAVDSLIHLRSFLSTYSVIRRFDQKAKKPAKQGKAVLA